MNESAVDFFLCFQQEYSLDEGDTWNTHKFIDEPMRVYGLITEPGENTTVFTMFGSKLGTHQWVIVTVDLRAAFRNFHFFSSPFVALLSAIFFETMPSFYYRCVGL